MKFLVYCGTITPSEDRTVVIEKGGDEESFSWTLTPGTNERVLNLFLYNGTQSAENEIWDAVNKMLKKGEDMFNGRLEVTYDDQKELTVTIKNAMLNDSITILLAGIFLNNNNFQVETFNYSVTLDVRGKIVLF